MQHVFENWTPDFMVSLVRDVVMPAVGVGILLVAMVWLIGYVVNSLFKLLKG